MDMTEDGVLVQRTGMMRKGLMDFISSLDLQDASMLEVGSYAGESSDMFSSSGKFKDVVCIDPWLPGYDSNDKASSSNMSAAEKEFDKVAQRHPNVMRKFKGTLGEFVSQNPDARPDLVYIDACHTYEGCKGDILNSLKLKPKIVSGHDYASWCPGVMKAVDEVLGKPHMRFQDGSWMVVLDSNTPFTEGV